MNDAERVRSLETSCRLPKQTRCRSRAQSPLTRAPSRQCLAIDELHHEKRNSTVGDAEVEHPHDSSRRELRHHACLVQEPRTCAFVSDQKRVQRFDRDVRPECEVDRLPHLTHSALADLAFELVTPSKHGASGNELRHSPFLRGEGTDRVGDRIGHRIIKIRGWRGASTKTSSGH